VTSMNDRETDVSV